MEEATGSIETLSDEIAALQQGIVELDKAVAEATEQRKTEHAENTETIANNNAAKDLIAIAKNRMQKFYNPKLFKPAPKRELTAEERISVNLGGTMAPTNPPGGIAGTGVTALVQEHVASESAKDAPPPPPETYGAYAKQSSAAGGVLAMMDMLVADLDKEIQEMEFEEKDAQMEYEEFMAASAEKRAADSKSMTDEHKATMEAAMAKGEQIKDLHLECDWLTQNYEVRKEARAGEVDALKKAKAVLSGADYSLVQTTVSRHLRGGQ